MAWLIGAMLIGATLKDPFPLLKYLAQFNLCVIMVVIKISGFRLGRGGIISICNPKSRIEILYRPIILI